MRKLFFILSFILACNAAFAQRVSPIKDCSYTKDFGMSSTTYSLWGTIRIVTDPKEHADFNVKILPQAEAADIRVKIVNNPSGCGEWKLVFSKDTAFINFTIRFVKKDEHFTIKFVDAIPGSSY
jgi:hypothetical protein